MRRPIIDPRYAVVEPPFGFLFDKTHCCADHLGEHAAPFERTSRVGGVAVSGQKLDTAHKGGHVEGGLRRRRCWHRRRRYRRQGLLRLQSANAGYFEDETRKQERRIGSEAILIGVEDDRPLRGIAVHPRGNLSQRVTLL